MHNIPDFLKISSEMQEHFAKGGMIKRADGSYSRRGLWDNIRANKGSGRKPTKEMLEQEAKIRAEEQYGGVVDEYGNGGYTVKRSSARKGKTHVVIGPDGTKKYFGDSKLGQHPKDPARKKAFYARHKHNLDNNPYFRAFARATWKDGGEIPMYASGTASVDPSQLNQDQLTNWNRFQYYASKNANITDPAYNTNRQMGYDLLNQYNQANPNNQVPVDTIPTYQAYFQKLQAGQTNVGQAGQEYVQKNFTQGVSPTDAFIGTQTLGSRVPMRGKKTVTNANTGQVVYNSGARPSTALPTPTPSQPVAQTNVPVPGMQTATLAYGGYYQDGGRNANNAFDLFASWKKEKPVFDVNQSMQDFIMRDPSRNVQQGPEVGPVVNNYDTWQNAWERPSRGSAESVMPRYYKDGGTYGPFYNRRDAAKMQRWRNPMASSMTPSFFAEGGLTKYQTKGFVDDPEGTSYMPQTINSGTGVNTTTPQQSPAVINQAIPNEDLSLPNIMGSEGTGQNFLTTASQALLNRKNSIKSGLQQGYNNFKNSVAGNDEFTLPTPMGSEGIGQNIKVSQPINTNKTVNTPASKPAASVNTGIQPSLSQSIAQLNNGLNGTAVTSGDTAIVDQGLQDYFNSKDHKFLQGIDQVQTGIGNLAKTITSINPNSQNAAVLGFDRQMNNTLTNRMTIAAPRKGIEYAKYGGKTSLKEGEELDLTTEQIHQLEKLGYKFQIL